MDAHSNTHNQKPKQKEKARRLSLGGTPPGLDAAGLEATCQMLSQGAVLLYPTDTIYGLGCSASEKAAIGRLFQLKGRPVEKGLLVLIEDPAWVEELADQIPGHFWKIQRLLWPGPFTFILKAAASLPADLIGETKTIGIRHPDLFFLRQLLREFGTPIVSTSANISGHSQGNTLFELIKDFEYRVDLIIESSVEPAPPSTVIDMTGSRPSIVRAGAQIERAERLISEL